MKIPQLKTQNLIPTQKPQNPHPNPKPQTANPKPQTPNPKQFPYKGDVGLVIAHKPNEQTVDVLVRPLLNSDMSISRFGVLGFGFWVLGFGFWVLVLGFGFWFWVLGFGFLVLWFLVFGLTLSRTLGSNRAGLVRRKFSKNLHVLREVFFVSI